MSQEKPFEATPSRIERAKREGDIARSQELGGAASCAAALGALCMVVTPIARVAHGMLVSAARGHACVAPFAQILGLGAVPLLCAAGAAVLAGALQTGGLHVVPISLKAERLAPAENLKRIFSREALVNAARGAAAFACAAGALAPAIAAVSGGALRSGTLGAAACAAWDGAIRATGVACAVGLVFAGADYAVQRTRWLQRLRMSFEEIKRDQKEHDGDPLARGRRRAMHRQIARGSLRRVREAAFVVTNPTHIAMALEYRPPEVPVPRVLVRSADETAARVRELAILHGIPLIEDVALARALYAQTQAGDFIPQGTYVAVAEIVAALQRSGAIA